MSQTLTTTEATLPPLSSPTTTGAGSSSSRSLRRLLHGVPTLVTFCLLAAVLWFGRQTHWQMPKLSALIGEAPAAAEDWCSEHSVPESICVQCKPELFPRPKEVGFCRAHGVAECVTCHPELAQVSDQSQLPKYDTVAAIGVLDRPVNNSRSTLHKSLVQFASREAVDRAGVDIDVVIERPMVEAISANGEVVFDPTRVAHLSARVPGTAIQVAKFVGDPVQAGDVLALIDSSQVGQAKAQLVQSVVQLQLRRSTLKRLKAAGEAVPGRSVIEAESAFQEAEVAVASAKQALANLGFAVPNDIDAKEPKQIADETRFLGIPGDLVDQMSDGTTTANLIPVRAPYSGVVMKSELVAGEVVDSSKTLFVVADPSRLWLNLAVRSEDARYVSVGLPVEFQADGASVRAAGKVQWISPTVNEQTRTLYVRVALDDAEGRLRDNTFGTGRIVLRREPSAVVVPREAIQSTPDASFVFVRDKNYFDENSPKVFHVRQVRIGARDDRYVEILAGALPGEVVVAKGSNVLLAQLLKSNLGAGCGCHE